MQSSAFSVGPNGFNSPFATSNKSLAFNNQGFSNQGFHNQGFHNQGFHNQGFNNQGSNNQGSNNQGFNNQGFNNQGFSNQGFHNQCFNNQGFNNQGFNNQGFNNQGSDKQCFNKPAFGQTRSVFDRMSGQRQQGLFFEYMKGNYKQKSFGSNEQSAQTFGGHGYVSPFDKTAPTEYKRSGHKQRRFGSSSLLDQAIKEQDERGYVSSFNKPVPIGDKRSGSFGPSTLLNQAINEQPVKIFGRQDHYSLFNKPAPERPIGQAQHNPSPFGQASGPFGQSTYQLFGQANQVQPSRSGHYNLPNPFGQTTQPFGQATHALINSSPFAQNTIKQSSFVQTTKSASSLAQPNIAQAPPAAGHTFSQVNQPTGRLNTSTGNLNSKLGFGQIKAPKVGNETIEKDASKKSSNTATAPQESVSKQHGKAPMGSMNMATQLQQKQQKPTKPTESNNTLVFLTSDPGRSTPEKRAQRFGQYQGLYQDFKERRAIERKQAIQAGLIPNPDKQTSLEDAIDFRGTCTSKCPDFEMLERDMQNDLDDLEKDSEGNIDLEKAVKKYRRSAAGGEQPLPSDVRTPEALNNTLDYLVNEILAKHTIDKCHKFVRDRTRSIRQDFTLQNIRDLSAVHAHERIARFHIISLHEMCEYDEPTFSLPQEMEQLHKTLISLMEFYDDLRDEGIEAENEAEFRAYHIISQIKDADIAQRSMLLPIHIFKNTYMKRALEFHALSQRNNEILETSSRRNKPENIEASQNFYSKFFKLIEDKDTSFLMACLLETHFSDVRKGALKAMNASYMMKAGGVQAEDVRQVLGYDTSKQLFREVMMYGIVINNSLGEPTLCFGQKHYAKKNFIFKEPLSNPSQRKSLLLVEPKKAGRSFEDIVNGVDPLPPQTPAVVNLKPIVPQQAQEKKEEDKSQHYLEIKNQVELANQRLEEEKKILEEMVQKKKKDDEEKERLAAELVEAEKRRKEEEMKREIMIQKQAEDERIMEQALVKEQEEKARVEAELVQAEKRRKELASIRLKASRAQACRKMYNEIMQQVLAEETKVAVVKNVRRQKVMKKVGLPWLQRARNRISKRQTKMMQLKENWHFNMHMVTHNPYISSKDTIYKAVPSHAKPDVIKERTNYALAAEAIALEDKDLPSTHDAIWAAENFSLDIYRRVRDNMLQINRSELEELMFKKPTWELLVSVRDFDGGSSSWFHHKFGLDEELHRKGSYYQDFNVGVRMVSQDTPIASDTVCQAGGVIFSLPESKFSKTQAEYDQYWIDNKKRLDKLVQSLHSLNPALKVPFLFTYFPEESNTEIVVQEIPTLLGLQSNPLVSDYHVLIMNPNTIVKRLREEIRWISRAPVW